MKKLSFKTTRQRIVFVSDIHFAHAKNFILEPRGYASVEDAMRHTREMLYEHILPTDVVINLGDSVVGAEQRSLEYAKEIVNLPCHAQYFLWGNHNAGMQQIYDEARAKSGLAASDQDVYPLRADNGRFVFLGHYAEIFIDNVPVVLSHYPIASWNHMSKGGYMIHGHCHRNLKEDLNLKRADVSWEWKRRPVSWDEIDRELRGREVVAPDHHGVRME